MCAETADAASAVEAALRERPDVCLLEVKLPGGGLVAAAEIRERICARARAIVGCGRSTCLASGEDADTHSRPRGQGSSVAAW